ncbi:patatin-like phospholipase family protein [Acidovorax lacteus]
MRNRLTTALVLSGGGARAAYQVGVLRALARMQAECTPATVPALRAQEAPFGIVVGTSAGAINSAAVACRADAFGDAVADLAQVWGNFHADQVYEADAWGVIRSGAHWITALSAGWAFARWRKLKPRSLLDNTPLASLLRELVPMERLPTMFARKHLGALAVTASSYSNGQHMTFYSSATPIEPWVRPQRQAVPGFLSHDHLLASSAIPFIFPARRLTHAGATTWFGDGSMRQTAPLSPAMHLGADRLLVVGAGRAQEAPAEQLPERRYPSMAQIAGHAMASVFLDTLAVDIERLERVNRVLSLMSPAARAETPWKTVRCLVVSPSQRIDDIAARHLEALPRPVRALLGGIGVARQGARTQGAALASYLLFEAPFTQELMALGEADAQARRQEILDFMDWSVVQDADHCAVPPGSCA